MRIFGHPVHPLLVPFPTALLPMDLGLCLLYHLRHDPGYYAAGAYCLWAGAAGGLLATLAGLIDWLAIPRHRKDALSAGLFHGALNGLMILIFAVIAFRSWQQFPQPVAASGAGIAVKTALVLLLFVGNFFGGKLIYRYQVGVRKPKS